MSGTNYYLDIHGLIRQAEHNLPHWHQEGKLQFITFRLGDSLPKAALEELEQMQRRFEASQTHNYDKHAVSKFNGEKFKKIEYWLSQGHGECLLRNVDLRSELVQSIDFFNLSRCLILSYVIMPNHVHLLMVPLGDYQTNKILGSIRQFSARRINKLLGRSGSLWQKEPFDRLIRSEEHLLGVDWYIQQNPRYLRETEFTLYRDDELIKAVIDNIALNSRKI